MVAPARLALLALLPILATMPALAGPEAAVLTLASSAFEPGTEIPVEHTCQGADTSPPLAWAELPAGTQSLVLIVDDPDAPDPKAPKLTWVHWVLYDIPPQVTGLPAAVQALPAGARQGQNSWKRQGYGGPCPPIGRHRYFHKLYALDTLLGDLGPADAAAVMAAAQGHILGRVELIGTYQKQ